MKSEIITDLLNSITEEDMERWRQDRIKSHRNLTADAMLGHYIGEEICRTSLPRLSTDGLGRFSRGIEVSKEDTEEYNRLQQLFHDNYKSNDYDSAKDEWIAYRTFAKTIEKKYLPNPFIARLGFFNVDAITDMKVFKRNFIESLWNDDFCHYDLNEENIKVYNAEDEGVGVIELVYIETPVK